jgi:hypothetical protein
MFAFPVPQLALDKIGARRAISAYCGSSELARREAKAEITVVHSTR